MIWTTHTLRPVIRKYRVLGSRNKVHLRED